jgi:hypothetical protein
MAGGRGSTNCASGASAVSLIAILLVVVALALKIREIDRRHEL